MTAGTKTDAEEVKGVEPASATLAIRLDPFCDFVSIVVVSGHVSQVWHVHYMMFVLFVVGRLRVF